MMLQAAKFCAMNSVRRKIYHEIFRRNSTKVTNKIVPVVGFKMASVSKEEKQKFNSFYPVIVNDLMDSVKRMNMPELMKWYPRMLEYNLLGGKQRRGLAAVLSYKLLENPKKLSEENIRLANIIGWSAEMLAASFLMIDDVVNRSVMRRGVPCWYNVEDVGLMAIIDAGVIEHHAYMILRKYFRDHPSYLPLIELFHETILKAFQGQILDHLNRSQFHQNLQHFTMDSYKTMAIYKFGFIAFGFPVSAAMHLAGIRDDELHRKATSVLNEMGLFLQIKNDFLDCFGDFDMSGTTLVGDIREGKCAWPAVVTLQRATAEQRAIMERCYGRSDEQSVQAVMDVYRALDMYTLYTSFEEEFFNNICNQIEQMDSRLPKKIFHSILEML